MPQSVVSCIEASKSRMKPISLPTLPIHRLWLGNILAVTGAEEHGAAKSDLSALISTPFHCEPFQVSHTHERRPTDWRRDASEHKVSALQHSWLSQPLSFWPACTCIRRKRLICSAASPPKAPRGEDSTTTTCALQLGRISCLPCVVAYRYSYIDECYMERS